jgi:hypothetical protein
MSYYLSFLGFVIAAFTFAVGIGAVMNARRISEHKHQSHPGT